VAVVAAQLVVFVVSVCDRLILFCWFVVAQLFVASYALAICHKATNWLIAQCVRMGSNGRASIWIAS